MPREMSEAEIAQKNAFLKKIDTDWAWAIRMSTWIHQPKEEPFRRLIDKFLALPEEKQLEYYDKLGFTSKAKPVPFSGDLSGDQGRTPIPKGSVRAAIRAGLEYK